MTPQLFIAESAHRKKIIEVKGEEIHYLRNVLRLHKGDNLVLSDGRGHRFHSVILELNKKKCILSLQHEMSEITESPINISLVQCLPRSKKMELIIQKTTELGVTSIFPVLSLRSFRPPSDEIGRKWVRRWQKIAEEAARQSGRSSIPTVAAIQNIYECLDNFNSSAEIFIFWEEADDFTKVTFNLDQRKSTSVVLVIGPEGGLIETEIENFREKGCQVLSLGPRILRCETAALIGVGLVQHRWGDLGFSKRNMSS